MRGGKGAVAHLAYFLAFVGGVLMIILGLLGILSNAVMMPFASPIGGFFGAASLR